ncbi:MAG: SPOR domain-containing protein, partial [Rufibacter sp.]
MIQGHIKSLLYTYDCVIIPEFGGLITHYAPAKIHPVKHTFTPPSKRIAFNEQLKVNDGLLITTLAHRQQWPLAQAQQAVSAFVQDLKEQLRTQNQFQLQDVGVFRHNAERKLVFECAENENFLEQSFGLPELVSKPIIGKESVVFRGNVKEAAAAEKERSKLSLRLRRLYRVGASLVVGGLTVTAVYFYSLQSGAALSSLNPFSLLSDVRTEAPATSSATQTADADAFEAEQLTEQYRAQLGETTVEEELAADDSLLANFGKNSSETAWGEEDVNASPEAQVTLEVKETPAPKAKVEVAASPNATVESTAASAEVKKSAKTESKAVAAVAPKTTAKTSTIKSRTGRFYVIMGVFTQDGYASKNQKSLKKRGYDAKIITPAHDRNRDRVSVADFATAEEAQAALPALRAKISQE